MLRLVLDLVQQVPPGMLRELRPVVDQAGRRAEDGRERRAEVVADRGQQRVAHPFRLGGRVGRHDLPRQPRPLQGGRRQLRHRLDQGADLGIERGPVESDAHDPDAAPGRAQGQEEPARRRQRVGPGAGSLVLVVGPAGRRGRRRVELVLRRPGSGQFNGVALGQEDRRGPAEIAVEFHNGRPRRPRSHRGSWRARG